jgi:hypothetical protein
MDWRTIAHAVCKYLNALQARVPSNNAMDNEPSAHRYALHVVR